ncbi:unnamed protein product [Sphagnum balticum]
MAHVRMGNGEALVELQPMAEGRKGLSVPTGRRCQGPHRGRGKRRLTKTGLPSAGLQIYSDGVPLGDQERLNARGVTEGGVVFWQIVQKPKEPARPKRGGIADMIKTFDKKIK